MCGHVASTFPLACETRAVAVYSNDLQNNRNYVLFSFFNDHKSTASFICFSCLPVEVFMMNILFVIHTQLSDFFQGRTYGQELTEDMSSMLKPFPLTNNLQEKLYFNMSQSRHVLFCHRSSLFAL